MKRTTSTKMRLVYNHQKVNKLYFWKTFLEKPTDAFDGHDGRFPVMHEMPASTGCLIANAGLLFSRVVTLGLAAST